MKTLDFVKRMTRLAAPAALVIIGTVIGSSHVRADDDTGDSNDARIRRGFEVAPVPLNLRYTDHELVGLGSYLVNVVAECNGCHSAGPMTAFARGGNPYFGQPEIVNQATYLGGGRNFGALVPGAPNIVSRNLTPDKTGRPAGGRTFEEFLHIFRTGDDLDDLHPNCSVTVTKNCLPLPFKGDLLQIMPWPAYRSMTVHDIRAIYEYLRAIPCIDGPPSPSVLHNDCM
jgi:hypothetical protein